MDTSFWGDLRLGFMQLRADCAIDPPLKSAGRLTAIWRAKPEPASWRLDHWNKKDGNGVTERYKWHAQSAAARQGFAGTGDEAVSFWLEQIRRDAPKSHIRRTLIEREGSDEVYSVEILDICGLSADYCRKCEADEIRSGAASVKTPTNWPELPPKFQNAFEAAKAKAELEYSNRAERFPHHPDLANNPLHRLKLILDVFFAFCTEARQACREGSWTVAQARQAVEAASPLICDFYFDQDHGGHSDGAKSAFRAAFTRAVTDDPQWKQHLSDLAMLAERALSGTRKDGSSQTITEGPIRAGRGARPQIEKFANDTFSVARDRILADHAQELNRLPGRVRRMGNSGAYLPARIKLEKEYLRTMILAQADAWLEALELFRVPCDAQTERDLRTCAQQMIGGSISAIRGDLRLRSGRLRIPEEGRGMPWHLEIERSMDSAVKEGVL